MEFSSLALLKALERADRTETLAAWTTAFARGMTRVTGALGCQVLQVQEDGNRLAPLGDEDPHVKVVLGPGHANLNPDQRRRIYRVGPNVVCLADLYDRTSPPPASLVAAMDRVGATNIVGLVAEPSASVALLFEQRRPLDLRSRQMLLSLTHHIGVALAVRSALDHDRRFDDELPARLSGILRELDERRRWAARSGDPSDAASALQFLAALADEGFAVVEEARRGLRRRLIAVRVKDPSARAMRALTPGERAVLKALREGRSLQEIAFELAIAEATVSGRIARIRLKLGIDPRSELIRVAGVGLPSD